MNEWMNEWMNERANEHTTTQWWRLPTIGLLNLYEWEGNKLFISLQPEYHIAGEETISSGVTGKLSNH